MGIIEIENAIKELAPDEVNELMLWFSKYHAEVWEDQITRDLDSGQLHGILKEVDSDISSGMAKPI